MFFANTNNILAKALRIAALFFVLFLLAGCTVTISTGSSSEGSSADDADQLITIDGLYAIENPEDVTLVVFTSCRPDVKNNSFKIPSFLHIGESSYSDEYTPTDKEIENIKNNGYPNTMEALTSTYDQRALAESTGYISINQVSESKADVDTVEKVMMVFTVSRLAMNSSSGTLEAPFAPDAIVPLDDAVYVTSYDEIKADMTSS